MDAGEIQTHLEVNGLALEDVPSVEEQEQVKEFFESFPELRRGKQTGLVRYWVKDPETREGQKQLMDIMHKDFAELREEYKKIHIPYGHGDLENAAGQLKSIHKEMKLCLPNWVLGYQYKTNWIILPKE
ncbi:hypothetical protein PGT21_007198 [Puccinia graminis f. sp. tritici]|uniref:Uncharacterized protein n=1 Tax=Puccinia graminis f. sp. tritici TaxID=56615 RepID=A0A5B0Q5G6_PUCGR|nr:hypothetical protein PGT21_007198 [Puccinia graminis f. sp. tritici]KAA1138735.1 hypothetical protein PGTUg99_035671 [Puccinia graminis f. sp. tritici]